MTPKQKRVFDAAICLYKSRRAYLQHAPHGYDCEGEYWIIRNAKPMKEFRAACASALLKKEPK